MKFKLIVVCIAAIFAMSGCKSTDSANSKAKSNSAEKEELCSQGTGSRLKKKC